MGRIALALLASLTLAACASPQQPVGTTAGAVGTYTHPYAYNDNCAYGYPSATYPGEYCPPYGYYGAGYYGYGYPGYDYAYGYGWPWFGVGGATGAVVTRPGSLLGGHQYRCHYRDRYGHVHYHYCHA